MGSDDSHFNVSLIVRDKVTRQCPQTTTFEEKGEPKRIRTEVPLLTSRTPYRRTILAFYRAASRDDRPIFVFIIFASTQTPLAESRRDQQEGDDLDSHEKVRHFCGSWGDQEEGGGAGPSS